MENIDQNKFKNFTKYVQRKDLSRFLVHSEIFKKILNQKGVIVECGVHYGGGYDLGSTFCNTRTIQLSS